MKDTSTMFVQTRRFSSSSGSKLADFKSRLSDNVWSGYNQLKGSLFQAMALRMNAKDKEEMIQYWGGKDELTKNIHVTVIAQQIPVAETPRSLPTPQFDQDVISQQNTLFHPILGEKLIDLGYKSLYLTSVRSLAVAPIWKKQRILRPERAQLIANDKIKNNLGSSLSGSISFYMDKKTKEIGIIDGQHRAGALMVLAQRGYWDEQARNILIEVFSTNTQAQVGALFREINAAEPVRLVDLLMQAEAPVADGPIATSSSSVSPNTDSAFFEKAASGVGALQGNEEELARRSESSSSEALVAMLDSAVDSLAAAHPEMFKPSSRCKPPHLNVDVLRDDLFQSEFLPRHDVKSAAELLALLEGVNGSLQTHYAQADSASQSKSAVTALKKATEHGFYLGLDKAWMYAIHAPVSSSKARRGKKAGPV